MVNVASIATIFIKVLKLILNFIILILYRYGYGGEFLGVGGTWNLNEAKNPTAEIIASGVFVGFFIYTTAIMIAYCFGTTSHKKTVQEILMNIVGTIMFVGVGAVAIHYWIGYQSEHKYVTSSSERQVGFTVGCLCLITGAIYLIDSVLSFIHFVRDQDYE